MKGYLIANYTVRDPETYPRYVLSPMGKTAMGNFRQIVGSQTSPGRRANREHPGSGDTQLDGDVSDPAGASGNPSIVRSATTLGLLAGSRAALLDSAHLRGQAVPAPRPA